MLVETKSRLTIIAKNIKDERRRQNLSQEELAYKVKIERKHLSSIENASQNFTLDTFLRISIALDIDPEDLFENKEKQET